MSYCLHGEREAGRQTTGGLIRIYSSDHTCLWLSETVKTQHSLTKCRTICNANVLGNVVEIPLVNNNNFKNCCNFNYLILIDEFKYIMS